MRFCTNSTPADMQQIIADRARAHLPPYVVTRPRATEHHTVEELERMGLRGYYLRDDYPTRPVPDGGAISETR